MEYYNSSFLQAAPNLMLNTNAGKEHGLELEQIMSDHNGHVIGGDRTGTFVTAETLRRSFSNPLK